MARKTNIRQNKGMEHAKRAVLLANGRPPLKTILEKHLRGADFFLCADGGANAAARLGFKPDMIIGDLDSIDKTSLRLYSSVKTRLVADQRSTDLEKALTYLVRNGYKQIDIFGATGGRTDHAIGNLSGAAKFQRKANIVIYDSDGVLLPVVSHFEGDFPAGTTVSLIPLTPCEGVITRGLKWNLRYETLSLGVREGTSNQVTSQPVTVDVRRGIMFLFRKYRN